MDPIVPLAAGSVGSILLAGNIFFIKRLVDKIDGTAEAVQRLEIRLARMETRQTKKDDHNAKSVRHSNSD